MGLGSVKRFGARYGRSIKEKFAIIEEAQRKLYECPGCLAVRVKRLAPGIWQCRKCGLKFAGKAYSVSKKIFIREEIEPGPEAGAAAHSEKDAKDAYGKEHKRAEKHGSTKQEQTQDQEKKTENAKPASSSIEAD